MNDKTVLDPAAVAEVFETFAADSGVSPADRAEIQLAVESGQPQGVPAVLVQEASVKDAPAQAAPAAPAADPGNQAAAAVLGETGRDMRTQISEMTIPQKIKLALFGNAICRGILIFDGNRMIPHFVLKNPKLSAPEIAEFVRNPSISDHILRAISDSKRWMKDNHVKYLLVTNPKTPGDVALKWMRYLKIGELKEIAKSRNIPQLVAVTAKKRVQEIEEKGGRE